MGVILLEDYTAMGVLGTWSSTVPWSVLMDPTSPLLELLVVDTSQHGHSDLSVHSDSFLLKSAFRFSAV